MNSVILDASALLAMLCHEPGHDVVARHLPGAMISTVNLAEVFSKSADKGVTLEALQWMVMTLQLRVVPFDDDAAYLVGSLREWTRSAGLSLGDRACLALAIQKRLPVLTTETSWLRTPLAVDICVIR